MHFCKYFHDFKASLSSFTMLLDRGKLAFSNACYLILRNEYLSTYSLNFMSIVITVFEILTHLYLDVSTTLPFVQTNPALFHPANWLKVRSVNYNTLAALNPEPGELWWSFGSVLGVEGSEDGGHVCQQLRRIKTVGPVFWTWLEMSKKKQQQ